MTAALYQFGAEEKTRTSTGKPPLDPEPSASTNSATSATIAALNIVVQKGFVNTFFCRYLQTTEGQVWNCNYYQIAQNTAPLPYDRILIRYLNSQFYFEEPSC